MFDTHNHCEFSCDSKMTLAQAAATAEKLGIGMILTEAGHRDDSHRTLGLRISYEPGDVPL